MTEASEPETKGELTPHADVRMTRLAAPATLRAVMRHWWIPSWHVPEGEVRDQSVLGYPVCNLVAEDGTLRLYGPTTHGTIRRLTGRGWACGALLQPSAGRHLAGREVATLVDTDVPVATTASLAGVDDARAAIAALLDPIAERLDRDDRAANELLTAVETDPSVRHVDDLAQRLHRSPRAVQRLSLRCIGLPPSAIIRRRRLQDAAEAVRTDPILPLSKVAADHGFADHAHLTREFAAVLGFTPSRYRDAAVPGPDRTRAGDTS